MKRAMLLVVTLTLWVTLLLVVECRSVALAYSHKPHLYRVTAYCDHGYTASGAWTGWGSVAAARSIPFGTELWIEGYGYGVVQDRGGVIWDGRLDVWFPDCYSAWQWGVRWVNVYHIS